MASHQQSRIQFYLEKNKIGPLFEEMMTKLITETPDHPVPFLINHLQTKQGSPGKLHRTLSGSAALWAQTSPAENKGTRRDGRSHEKPWQMHPKKPKKSKSDLAVSNISPPSPESKSLPRSSERPSCYWRTRPESRGFDELSHILQESKKLGKALENLTRSIAVSDELEQDSRAYTSLMRPRVIGEWVGRDEEDADPLAAEMLQPPVPRAKEELWETEYNGTAGSLKVEPKSKGLKQQQQHHKKLLAAMLSQDSFDSAPGSVPAVAEEEIDDEDDAMELLEDLDDLRMEGVTSAVPSGSKFGQGRSSYCLEPQARVTLNICSRCARLQGDSLTDARDDEVLQVQVPEQALPETFCPLPGIETLMGEGEFERPSHGTGPRQLVWDWDLKSARSGGSLGQKGLQSKDSLFTKELQSMEKHLAEVEKDLAKLTEVKMARSPNSPHSSLLLGPPLHSPLSQPGPLLHSPLVHTPGSLPGKTGALPRISSKPTSLTAGWTSTPSNPSGHSPSNPGSRPPSNPGSRPPSNPSSRPPTPGSRPRTPSRPLTPNSLTPWALTEEAFGGLRSRPVTPTGPSGRPLLTPPGLSSTDSLPKVHTLSEDEFCQQLQAIRQPWLIPSSDTESDCMELPEKDKCEYGSQSATREATKRSVYSGL